MRKNLYDYIMNEYNNSVYKIDKKLKIISRSDHAYGFIKNELIKNGKGELFKINFSRKNNPYRYNHVIVTYYLGLLFMDFCGLKGKIIKQYINNDLGLTVNQMWLLTALLHDYGYFELDNIKNSKNDFNLKKDIINNRIFDEEICIKENVLNLNVNNTLYAKSELINYLVYKKRFFSNPDECIDHGIFGGTTCFNNYISMLEKIFNKKSFDYNNFCNNRIIIHEKTTDKDHFYSLTGLKQFKNICWTIMCHNVFLSDSEEKDRYLKNFERIKSTSDFVITEEYSLDFLLGLVDTIEYTKRLCKKNGKNDFYTKGNNSPEAITKNIFIDVKLDYIELDFSNVLTKNSNDVKKLQCYFNGILQLPSWLNVRVEKNNKIIKISKGNGQRQRYLSKMIHSNIKENETVKKTINNYSNESKKR